MFISIIFKLEKNIKDITIKSIWKKHPDNIYITLTLFLEPVKCAHLNPPFHNKIPCTNFIHRTYLQTVKTKTLILENFNEQYYHSQTYNIKNYYKFKKKIKNTTNS